MKPILFNTEMVKAILDGRKAATRRLIKDVTGMEFRGTVVQGDRRDIGKVLFRLLPDEHRLISVPYKIGDILYVRETWAEMPYGYVYRTDGEPEGWDPDDRWRPSIHMPKEAARIFLKVTDVRIEKLLEMSVEDALKEGVNTKHIVTKEGIIEYRLWNLMSEIWDSTIPKKEIRKYGWEANPWVWVIEFERIEKPE